MTIQAFMTCMAVQFAYSPVAQLAAEKYQLPPLVYHALILAESKYDPKAINDKAAVASYGLAQLTIDTALERCNLGFNEIMDPVKNIDCGAKVLSQHLRHHHGKLDLALSAYNAGTATPTNKAYVEGVYTELRKLHQGDYGCSKQGALNPSTLRSNH